MTISLPGATDTEKLEPVMIDTDYALVERLRLALETAIAQRSRLPEFQHGVPKWVHFERQTMLDAVNAERARISKAPIELAALLLAEERAFGHDYKVRFPHLCAQLVLDTFDHQPGVLQ